MRKLYRWHWSGLGPGGRRVRGESVAASRHDVERELLSQAIHVKRVRRKSGLNGGTGRITSRDVMLFARQLATLLRAGVPVLQAFQVVNGSIHKPALSAVVQQLMHEVAAGSSLARALRRYPAHFDSLFCNLVEAGESSGSLEQMLDRVATYKEKVETLKARVKKALWYPIAVVVVGGGVTALLLIQVVPQFESLFHGFGAELPGMTRLTITLSEFAQHYWLRGLVGLMLLAWLLRQGLKRSARFTYRLHALLLRLPIVGGIFDKSAVARYARTLATTYGAGVPMLEALNIAAGATGNQVYEHVARQLRDDVATGQPLHFAMRLSERFPTMAVQMVGIGEESGALDAMLNRIAEYYEEEVTNQVDALTSLLEPLIIVILGLLVGGLVISMYLPIFELGTVL